MSISYNYFRTKYDIPSSFRLNGEGVKFYGEGEIIVGNESYIGRYSSIQAKKDTTVCIGDNCAISHFVQIYTANRIANQDLSNTNRIERGDVKIENNVWIGSFSYISQNVRIGENAVIGTHAVVTLDIPPDCVAVGAPARVIKFKDYVSESEKKQYIKRFEPVISDQLKQVHE